MSEPGLEILPLITKSAPSTSWSSCWSISYECEILRRAPGVMLTGKLSYRSKSTTSSPVTFVIIFGTSMIHKFSSKYSSDELFLAKEIQPPKRTPCSPAYKKLGIPSPLYIAIAIAAVARRHRSSSRWLLLASLWAGTTRTIEIMAIGDHTFPKKTKTPSPEKQEARAARPPHHCHGPSCALLPFGAGKRGRDGPRWKIVCVVLVVENTVTPAARSELRVLCNLGCQRHQGCSPKRTLLNSPSSDRPSDRLKGPIFPSDIQGRSTRTAVPLSRAACLGSSQGGTLLLSGDGEKSNSVQRSTIGRVDLSYAPAYTVPEF